MRAMRLVILLDSDEQICRENGVSAIWFPAVPAFRHPDRGRGPRRVSRRHSALPCAAAKAAYSRVAQSPDGSGPGEPGGRSGRRASWTIPMPAVCRMPPTTRQRSFDRSSVAAPPVAPRNRRDHRASRRESRNGPAVRSSPSGTWADRLHRSMLFEPARGTTIVTHDIRPACRVSEGSVLPLSTRSQP